MDIEKQARALVNMIVELEPAMLEVVEENKGLKAMIAKINERVMPGVADSEDCLRQILKEHTKFKETLETISRLPDSTSARLATIVLEVEL